MGHKTNCGPGALAAIYGKTLDEVRPHMKDFEKKHYTNPTMMAGAPKSLGVPFHLTTLYTGSVARGLLPRC